MARNHVLQISCNEKLKQDILSYQKEKQLDTLSEAGRELITFALRVLSNPKADEGVSNRMLMEEILRVAQYNSMTTNVVHGQTFDMNHLNENKIAASTLRAKLKTGAESKVGDFLNGKQG